MCGHTPHPAIQAIGCLTSAQRINVVIMCIHRGSCPGYCVTSAFEGKRFSVVCWKAGGGELPGTGVTEVDAHVFCSLPVA